MKSFAKSALFKTPVLALVVLLAAAAPADLVRLKNGNALEGVVKSESATEVVLEIGFGTMTLPKASVAAIERAGAQPAQALQKTWQQQNILHERYAPHGLADVQQELLKLQGQHGAALQTHRRMTELQQKMRQEEQELRQGQDQEIALNKQLSRSPGSSRGAVKAYNDGVARLHGLHARILELYKNTEKHQSDMAQGQRELAAYTAAVFAFAERVQGRKRQGAGADEPQAVAAFFAAVDAQLAAYRSEIQQVRIPYQRDKSRMEVTATLNGAVEGRFVVDTGASAMCISEALAQKLNLTRNATEVQTSLADGSTRKARAVLLNSVEIEGVRVARVMTLIMPRGPAPGVDGLLGMSFLSGCNLRMDPASGELRLQRFAPP
ncbi:MAG: retropepsin-like aspartic protease [Kiritimatiellaeota bacterium]|nr:retropepsin-like aspartic protease [Kiritimatiellota bacterium]